MSSPHDSRGIANEILKVARVQDKPLTIMQLLKLIYYAHGFSLGILDRPLTFHEAQAWQYGPVFPHVYKVFKKAGSAPITTLAFNKETGNTYTADLDSDERALIDAVVDGYGSKHAFELSNMLHQKGSAWTQVFDSGDGAYKAISNDLIKAEFDTILRNREKAVQA